ncbi:MAG: hypothetical protein IPI23_15915 [Bacteroidetes bacterium]|nr:hypothetical protein [Bacteroidota bacterium]
MQLQTRENVSELILKNQKLIAHASIAYLDKTNNNLLRTALTSERICRTFKALIKLGFKLDTSADLVVSPGMHYATQEILGINIFMNPYSYLFDVDEEISPEENDSLKMFMELTIPHINENTTPNLKLIAKQTGMELKIVEGLWAMMKSKA